MVFFLVGNRHFSGSEHPDVFLVRTKRFSFFSLAINCLSYLFPLYFQSFESRAGGNILLIMSVGPKKCYSPLCPVIQPWDNIMFFFILQHIVLTGRLRHTLISCCN